MNRSSRGVIRDEKSAGYYVKIDISFFTCNNREKLSAGTDKKDIADSKIQREQWRRYSHEMTRCVQ